MASKSQISLAMLPVEDIADYLTIVQGFTKKDQRATDTDLVAGIDAKLIAKAATNDKNELLEDRETVKNALNLGGKEASQYLTIEDSGNLLEDTYTISNIINDGLKSVRDEFYQLKGELAKAGLIKQNHVYNGFYDAFRVGEERYINNIITRVSGDFGSGNINTITVQDTSDLIPGEYICFANTSNDMQLAKITDINSGTLNFESSVTGPINNQTPIYKTSGSYAENAFVFGKDNGQYTASDISKVIVKDGPERVAIRAIDGTTKGFGTKVAGFYSLNGMLRKVQFSLAINGNPGTIQARVYRIDNNKYTLLGESLPLYSSEASTVLSNKTFAFQEPIEIFNNKEYIIALISNGTTKDNKWLVGGFYDACDESCQCICCPADTFAYVNDTFEPEPDKNDSFIALFMSEVLTNTINYDNYGVYSCKTSTEYDFTRVRVELRINREGIFEVADSSSNFTLKGQTVYLLETESSGAPSLFNSGDTVVIGNNIAHVDSGSNSGLKLKEDTVTIPGSDVYRVGYKVQVKAVPSAEKLNNSLAELKLVAIIPGKEPGKEDSSSDRLIFEGEIKSTDGVLSTYNDLEVQVIWNSSVNKDLINASKSIAGKIYDISVSVDKAYKSKE